jgi:hypothetical protein
MHFHIDRLNGVGYHSKWILLCSFATFLQPWRTLEEIVLEPHFLVANEPLDLSFNVEFSPTVTCYNIPKVASETPYVFGRSSAYQSGASDSVLSSKHCQLC